MIKSIISALGFFHRGFLIMAGFALCMLFCACVLMLPVSQNGGTHLFLCQLIGYLVEWLHHKTALAVVQPQQVAIELFEIGRAHV